MNIKHRSEYKNFIDYFSFFFIIIFLIRFIGEISSGNNYNSDIDHEMYFGTRLLNGELLYTYELNDKLPFLQFIFAIPAYFKNVIIWIVLSTFLSLIAALSLNKSLKNLLILYFPKITRSEILSISKISSCFYLFSISSIYGSLGMINHYAASCCLLTLCFLINSYTKEGNVSIILNILFSALFGAMSISIRPYYIAPIILIGIWIFIKNILKNIDQSNSSKKYLKKFKFRMSVFKLFIWLILLIVFGLIINVTPYIPNNLTYLIDGILHNSNSLQNQNLYTIIKKQLFILPFGSLTFVISSITIIFSAIISISFIKENFRKNHKKSIRDFKIDVFFIGFLAPLLLEVIILTKHFFSHYFQLFIPFITFSIAFLLSYLRENFSIRINNKRFSNKFLNFFLILIIATSSSEVKTSIGSLSNYFQSSQKELELNQISEYLEEKKGNFEIIDFLHLSNMHLHWNLNESRHGFPHAANIKHISNDYWKDLKREYKLFIPKDKEKLCKMINNSDIKIVFTDKNSNIFNECLLDKNSRYKIDKNFIINANKINAFIAK